jgi:hypothetical protein
MFRVEFVYSLHFEFMQLFRHYREKLSLFFLMLINKNCFYTDISCLGGVFAKNTSRETKSFPDRKSVYLSQDGYFRYTTYGDRILFNEDPFAQSIPLTKIIPRITSIHEKSQVVCTLRDRFTDICPKFSER